VSTGPKRDDNADQSNDGQANTDHRRRNGEDVNANILLEVAVCVAPPLPFSFHATSV